MSDFKKWAKSPPLGWNSWDCFGAAVNEKQLRENGDKLSEEDKATVQSEIDSFKKVREGNNASEIKSAMDAMTQKVYSIFGKLYQQQGGQPGGPDMGGYQQAGPQAGTQNDDGSFNADGSVQ